MIAGVSLPSPSYRSSALLLVLLADVWLAYSGSALSNSLRFLVFLALLVLLAWLFEGWLGPESRYAVLFGVAWYGLNPANITGISDPARLPLLLSTLGIAAALRLYQWKPEWRRYWVYLLPVLVASLMHRVALAFAPLLFLTVFLFEEDGAWRNLPAVVLRCIPGVLASLPALPVKAAPLRDATIPAAISQSLAAFLAPWVPFASPSGSGVSAAVTIVLVGTAVAAGWRRATRPVCFGLCWFLVAMLVAPAEPLAAFIGLAFCGVWVLARIVAVVRGWQTGLLWTACGGLLLACGLAVGQTPGPDTPPPAPTVAAVPGTAEQWLALSAQYYQAKKYPETIAAALAALRLKPDYAEAYNNIAAAYNDQKKWDEAIQAAQKALQLKPDFPLARNNLNWALEQKRLGNR